MLYPAATRKMFDLDKIMARLTKLPTRRGVRIKGEEG